MGFTIRRTVSICLIPVCAFCALYLKTRTILALGEDAQFTDKTSPRPSLDGVY
jgi:hypothetical protein